MPELPEVETIRRQLAHDLTGYTVADVKTTWEKSFRPSFEAVEKVIIGKKIAKVDRQAKLIIFKLRSVERSASGGEWKYLLFHLKLTGRMLVRKPSDPPDEYPRSVFTLVAPQGLALPFARRGLRETKELRFADARKFGYVRLIADRREMEKVLQSFGPEPLKDLTLPKFSQILKSSSRPVKQVLLDQTKISGLGNIYANDALWRARIDPRIPANKLVSRKAGKLFKAVLEVLKRGIKYGGASDQWYVQAHGEKGEYQKHFLVYGKKGEPCQRCQTEIQRLVVGGRGTFFCPKCQKMS